MAYQSTHDRRVSWSVAGSRRWALPVVLIWGLTGSGLAHGEAVAVSIEPTLDQEVDAALAASANLPTLLAGGAAPQPPSTAWTAAVAAEANRLAAILRGFGYLDGRVDVIDSAAPISVNFRPVPGPLYRIGLIEVTGMSDVGSESEVQDIIDRAIGEPPRGDVLRAITDRIQRYARDRAYPHTEVAHEVHGDSATATAVVRIDVTLGTKVRLGEISFYGAKATDPQVLAALHPFAAGSDYTPRALEALRTSVESLPLVRRARVEMEDRADANGLVPVRVTIVERGDPGRLTHLKLAGSIALMVTLAALSLRQWVQTGQRRPSAQVVQSLDLAVLVLLIAGLALVLGRALSFLE